MDDKFSYDETGRILLYKGENIGITPEMIQDIYASEYRGGQVYIDFIESELEKKYQKMYKWKIREKKIEDILGYVG